MARPLAVLRGDLEDLLADPRHVAAEQAWCQVTLTDPVRPPAAMDQLRRRFPHTLVLQFDPQGTPVPVRSYAQRATLEQPLDVCCSFLDHVRGGHAPTDAEREVLATAVEAVRTGRAGHDDEGQLASSARRVGAA